MNVEVKTQHVYRFSTEGDPYYNPVLRNYVDALIAAQSNGALKQRPTDKTLFFPNVDNKEVPISLYKMFVNNDLVEMTDFPLFIYGPLSMLEENVFEGLPGAVTSELVGGELVETPVKWKDWKKNVNYDQPLCQNETDVIISCQYGGDKLTEEQASIIITQEALEGSEIELMGVAEFLTKKEVEFLTEE